MAIKRFVASNMREALNLARNDLGEDVAIVNTKSISNGVELNALLDPKLPYVAVNEDQADIGLEQLYDQILTLQDLVITQLKEFNFYQKQANMTIQHLLRLGISFDVASKIESNFTFAENLEQRSRWRFLLMQLTKMLNVKEIAYDEPLFFAGPSYSDTLQVVGAVARYFLTTISLKPVIYAVNQTSDNLLQLKMLGRKLQVKVIEHLPIAPSVGHLIIGEYSDIPSFATLVKVLPCVWQSNNLMQYCMQMPASDVIFTQFEKASNLGAMLDVLLGQNNSLIGISSPYFSTLKAHHVVSRAVGLQFNNPTNEHIVRNLLAP